MDAVYEEESSVFQSKCFNKLQRAWHLHFSFMYTNKTWPRSHGIIKRKLSLSLICICFIFLHILTKILQRTTR